MEQSIMHIEALEHISQSFNNWVGDKKDLNVLEIGSLDINGSVRPIFINHARTYLGVDIQDGPGVDLVVDAAGMDTGPVFDVVVCAEVFEHAPEWREIIIRAHGNLVEGGIFIATMAGEGRAPHSAIDENPIRPWEHYENINRKELRKALKNFSKCKVSVLGTDTRCWAIK
jgi:hypothetical protein